MAVKINFPGLIVEKLPSGNNRYRVRKIGNPRIRTNLHVSPGHQDFTEHYHAARLGIEIKPEMKPEEKAIHHSLAWLIYKYLDMFEKKVIAGQFSEKTLIKRKRILGKLRDLYGNNPMLMPQANILRYRDELIATPAAADSMVEALRVMYRWAIDDGILSVNPAVGIGKVDKNKGGATPWTVADLLKFREYHKPGTTPHLTLTLLMFSACRIGDAVWLGRDNETMRDAIRVLEWQPTKKNAAYVEIPMLPPLYKATRASKVLGKCYILSNRGRPYSSADSLSGTFIQWCKDAGLENRSAHGIRKAAGHLLARAGCSQYQIMAIHGHTEARTSEVYTKGVERWNMAAEAMNKLETMEW